MDPITFRFIERMLAIVIGGIAIFLGYRMFLKIPESRDSEGKITLPWNINVILSRVGPGVFFALFGAGVVAVSLFKGLEISERKPGSTVEAATPAAGAGGESREIKWGAAPSPAGEAAARADARALLRKDIGILNNLTSALRSDLPEHERNSFEFGIPRIKFALMRPIWGEAEAGWGTPSEFERWLEDREPDPPPPQIAGAVEYYRYARPETKP
jgi:hypothetical protein